MGANTAAMVAMLAALEQQQVSRRMGALRRRREREKQTMDNTMLCALKGREVILTLGATGSVKGTVERVADNWLELRTKKGLQLVNADYISTIQPQG